MKCAAAPYLGQPGLYMEVPTEPSKDVPISSEDLPSIGLLLGTSSAAPYNTFGGPGFPACNNVAAVYHATSVDEMVSIIKNAADNNIPV
jgi:hypothetical protein